MKKLISLLLVMAMLASLLAGCGNKEQNSQADTQNGNAGVSTDASTNTDKKIKDKVTVVLSSEPSGIDPQNANQTNAFAIMTQVFNNLITLDEDGNPVPSLATSWEQIDEVTMRFHLRDDVTFHNGEKLTAEDVRFTIERATTTANSMGMFANFDGEKTKVVDEHTVDIVTKVPFAPIFAYLSMTRAFIVNKKAIQEMGDDASLRNPIGTGPFSFVEWKSGTSVSLKRYDGFWGNKPAYSELVFRIVPEGASRAIEVETGSADIAYTPDTSDVLRLRASGAVQTDVVPTYGGVSLYLNVSKDPVVSDKRVREAMLRAINLEDLVYAVYGDLGIVPIGVAPASFSAAKKLDLYSYDPDKAKALLAEAGYSKDNPAKLSFYVYNSTEGNACAEIVQNYWTTVGFEVDYQQMDWATLGPKVKAYEGSVWICPWTYAVDDFGFFANDYDPANTASTSYAYDEELSRIQKEAMACMDPVKRKELYGEFQERMYTDQILTANLADRTVCYLFTKNVEGFKGNAGGCPYLGDIIVYE